jgi:hypothetical protein
MTLNIYLYHDRPTELLKFDEKSMIDKAIKNNDALLLDRLSQTGIDYIIKEYIDKSRLEGNFYNIRIIPDYKYEGDLVIEVDVTRILYFAADLLSKPAFNKLIAIMDNQVAKAFVKNKATFINLEKAKYINQPNKLHMPKTKELLVKQYHKLNSRDYINKHINSLPSDEMQKAINVYAETIKRITTTLTIFD